ncbi:hypothetical protein BGZ96_008960, partial [Linnemannia gamsii]
HAAPKTPTFTAKAGPYVIPKRSQLGPWSGQAPESGSRPSEPNSFGAGRSPNWRKGHHRGGSWTSTDNGQDGRRGSATRFTNDGSRTSSGKWRARLEDREDGHVGLPPRVENKFRPRYRQDRQGQGQGRRYPPQSGSAALPPTPPIMHMGFGGPRSRHQSRSGTVLDAPTTNDSDFHASHPRDAQQPSQDHAPRYEYSQLRMHGKTTSGSTVSRLTGQRNKSLVDLRGMEATNQPWRQSTGSNEPNSASQSPLGASTKPRIQNVNGFDSAPRKNGADTHPLEQSFPNPNSTKMRPAEKGLGLTDGDATKDNVYHPPHWHERKSISSGVSNQSRRPSSGYESDIGSRHRHDTSGSLSSLSSLSKSQSGSRGGVRPGAGAGGGYSGLNMTSPPLDRKGQQRTADTASNWRATSGAHESSSRHTKKGSSESGILSLDSASSSIISLNLTRADGLADSPSMILTPPTPNVNRKSEFLSDGPVPPVPLISAMVHEDLGDGSAVANGEAGKKIVKPGTMAGLGSMLRGLVAYNKNIKVAGETTGPLEATDSEPRALGASDFKPRPDRDSSMNP